MIPWLRPWTEVRELYASLERQKDALRAMAALAGIRTGYAHLRPDDTRAWANVIGVGTPRIEGKK